MNAEVLTVWGIFAGVGWFLYIITSNRRRAQIAQTQADMQAKLLDKLSASQDLAEYLKTDSGQRLLMAVPADAPRHPLSRILGSIQAGVVMTLVGLALLFLTGRIAEAEEGLTIFGTISLAVGLGFLISSLISYLLTKSWGLVERRDNLPR